MPVWINSPLNGDEVPQNFNVSVGWSQIAFETTTTLRVSVGSGGTVNPASVDLGVADGDYNFQVTNAGTGDPVTITATLTGASTDSDTKNVRIVAVAPVVVIGGGPPAPPGPIVPLTTDARPEKVLILAGLAAPEVSGVEVQVYAFSGKGQLLESELTRQAGLLNGIWAVALPRRFLNPHPQKKHRYHVAVTALGGISGGRLATTSAPIAPFKLESDPPM